jgi:hypothetical protein
VTWVPVPPIPLAGSKARRLCEGYSVCPETGEIRSARNELLKPRYVDARTLGIHVWAQEPNGRRVGTTSSLPRLIAVALLRAGLVHPPTPGSHCERVGTLDRRTPPTLQNLRWFAVGDAAPEPLRLTARGLELLGTVPTPGGPC